MKLHSFAPEDDADEPVIRPDLRIVDAHHHLWPLGARIPYDASALADDLESGHHVAGTVFVECMAAYGDDADTALRPAGETRFIARSFRKPPSVQQPFIGAAIVGWADLCDPKTARRTLAAQIEAGQGRLAGIRHNAVWHERTELVGGRVFPRHLLAEASFRESLGELGRLGLTYDVWVFHEQLPEVAAVADALPDLRIVVDHIGGPVTRDASVHGRQAIFSAWRHEIEALAERPNVRIKFGGLGMTNYAFGFADRPRRPGSRELAAAWRPYFDVVVGAFGADRVMFESNFPVDKQSFSYRAVWNAFKRLASPGSDVERHLLLGGTAIATYGIDLG